MHNEFTAIIERDGEWFIAYCPEVTGANGQGHTKDECLRNLADAIELILEDRREDALRGLPEDAMQEVALMFVVPAKAGIQGSSKKTQVSNLKSYT